MIKDILVNLPTGDRNDFTADYAISVARTLDAHLSAVAFAHEPIVPGNIFDGISASIVATYRQENERIAKEATERFEKSARSANLMVDARVLGSTIEGAGDTFGRLARNSDLSIVRQSDGGGYAEDLIIEAALFSSGRPVLVVPYIQKDGFKLDRVLLCWDGSRHATRAISDALPLLERSKDVEIVTITTKDDNKGEISGADIAHHLARHQLKVTLNRLVSVDVEVTSTILNRAADTGADLIVMGAYGHSRLREFILGGATHGMLNSMTVPTLMSH